MCATRTARTNKFFVQTNSCAKTKQSLKASGGKIWNDFRKNIREKAVILSNKILSKLLKKTFYDSSYCNECKICPVAIFG